MKKILRALKKDKENRKNAINQLQTPAQTAFAKPRQANQTIRDYESLQEFFQFVRNTRKPPLVIPTHILDSPELRSLITTVLMKSPQQNVDSQTFQKIVANAVFEEHFGPLQFQEINSTFVDNLSETDRFILTSQKGSPSLIDNHKTMIGFIKAFDNHLAHRDPKQKQIFVSRFKTELFSSELLRNILAEQLGSKNDANSLEQALASLDQKGLAALYERYVSSLSPIDVHFLQNKLGDDALRLPIDLADNLHDAHDAESLEYSDDPAISGEEESSELTSNNEPADDHHEVRGYPVIPDSDILNVLNQWDNLIDCLHNWDRAYDTYRRDDNNENVKACQDSEVALTAKVQDFTTAITTAWPDPNVREAKLASISDKLMHQGNDWQTVLGECRCVTSLTELIAVDLNHHTPKL